MVIAHWEQYRRDGVSKPAVEMALEFVEQGNSNEIELGFYVLVDLAVNDASLQRHVSQLAKHTSAKVRRNLTFYLSRELPSEFSRSVYTELLRDETDSVQIRAIETISLRGCKTMLSDLHELRSHEQSAKKIQSLDYWIPLLENGYRVDPCRELGCFVVTALTGRGTASRIVEASGPSDPRIRTVVEEIPRFP